MEKVRRGQEGGEKGKAILAETIGERQVCVRLGVEEDSAIEKQGTEQSEKRKGQRGGLTHETALDGASKTICNSPVKTKRHGLVQAI